MAKKRRTSTKTKIVKAAWKLFYKQGYEDTTVDEIIATSGTSKGSFYHYFKGKDELLSSLSYLFDQKYEELISTADSEMNSYDKLMFFNYELFHMIETEVDLSLLAMMYSSQLVTKSDRHLLDEDRIYYRFLRQTILEGQERKELRSDKSAEEIAKLYAMMERALLYDWCLCKGSYCLSDYSQQILAMILKNFIWENNEKQMPPKR